MKTIIQPGNPRNQFYNTIDNFTSQHQKLQDKQVNGHNGYKIGKIETAYTNREKKFFTLNRN